MDVWEQKLELAESISCQKFTPGQIDVFAEDKKDLAFFFFARQEGQTTVGLTYALVNAYWKPNSKYLYVSNDSPACTHAKNIAAGMTKHFRICRPERTYLAIDGHVSIGFGETKSEVKFHTLNSYNIGEDFDAIIMDATYNNLHMKHINKFSSVLVTGGKLMIMAQIDSESPKLSETHNKLDVMIEEAGISC